MNGASRHSLVQILLRASFAIVGAIVTLPLFFGLVFFGGVGTGTPAIDLFSLEWIAFIAASFFFAWRPPGFKSIPLRVAVIGCYSVLALCNLMLIFEGGTCFDQYGNLYPYAGLNPYVPQICIPIL